MRASHLFRSLAGGRSSHPPADPPPMPRATITEDEAFVVIRDAITAVLDAPAAAVTRETRLAEDLHADSLALVEIVEIVEERLADGWPGLIRASFRLEDAGLEALQTVGDAVHYVVTSL
jgi:acyl carrier protein